jgi:hypothetical protein
MVWTYPVGLAKSGAAGAVEDEDGNFSKPIDLPYEGRTREFGPQDSSEYWPEMPFNREIDKKGVMRSIGECVAPEVSKT